MGAGHYSHVSLDLLHVVGHVQSVSGSLGKSGTGVDGKGGRDSAKHEDSAPYIVGVLGALGHALEAGGDDDGHSGGSDVAKPLHGEHRGDEGTTVGPVGVLGHDGGGEGVVTSDTETEDEAPEAEGGNNSLRGATKGETRADGCDNHNEKSKTIRKLASEVVPHPTEEELTSESSTESDTRDCQVDAKGQVPRVVDHSNELGHKSDVEEVVGVGEESHTSHQNRLNVEP